jgi:hypothetical protein
VVPGQQGGAEAGEEGPGEEGARDPALAAEERADGQQAAAEREVDPRGGGLRLEEAEAALRRRKGGCGV